MPALHKSLTIPLTLAVLTTAAACQGAFDEAFDAPALGDRWQWSVPVEGPTLSLTEKPGWLRLRMPQRPTGFNHWAGIYAAPLLSTPLPEGDWDAETHLVLAERGPDSTFHVGFAVVFSPERLLAAGPFRAPQFQAPEPEVWLEPTGRGAFRKAGSAEGDLWLQFRKRGWEYRVYLKRAADAEWQEFGLYATTDAPRAIGFLGKTFGDGQAVALDVDYLRVTEGPATASERLPEATVRVRADGELARLNPRRNGQFIEHMHRCIYGGFWAEMLRNRKFTGDASPQGVIEGWEPVGAGDGVTFARDNAAYYVPAQAQRIASTTNREHGLQQAGLQRRAGVGLVGRVVLRAEGLGGPVTVAIREADRVVSETRVEPTAEWKAFDFEFPALPAGGPPVVPVSLAITTRSPGTLWVGCASLMPADNLDGFRADVIALCRRMQIPSLRYPGGNFVSGYHWEDGIGPRDRRPPRWNRAWGGWEWNDVGTHEYFRLCELLNCEPYITVNAGEGTPTEAAAWVEYVNGAPDTPQGKRRAANAHARPFGCPLWSIGNEMYGSWQLGHLDATQYAIRTVEFADAMRAADPRIELIVNGVEGPNPWNVRMAEVTGHIVDYLSVHHYTGDDPRRSPLEDYGHIVSTPLYLEGMLARTWEENRQHTPGGKPLPLMFDEWNVWTQLANQQGYEDFYQLRDGLYAVGVLNALVRLGDEVPGAHLAQTVNVLGAIRTNDTQAVASPIALAFQLHAEHGGPWRVPVEVDTPRMPFPGVNGELPLVDAVGMFSEQKDQLHLILINRHPTEDIPCSLAIGDFTPTSATLTTMAGPSWDAINTFEQPDTVKLETRDLQGDEWKRLVLPKHSAVAVTMRR
jgi:alpha-N-arabinofuranosidase